MNLEDQLRTALRRRALPDGFAERVAAEAIRSSRGKPARRLRWVAAAIAAAVLLAFTVSVQLQHRRSEAAGRQAVLALRIAAEKLNLARSKALRLETVVQVPGGSRDGGGVEN